MEFFFFFTIMYLIVQKVQTSDQFTNHIGEFRETHKVLLSPGSGLSEAAPL
jgi:hypothetical protein